MTPEQKRIAIADIIKANVEPSSRADKTPYYCPWDVGAYLWEETKEFAHWPDDTEPERNQMAEALLGKHILSHSNMLWEWVVKAKELCLTDKYAYVGDLDVYLDMVYDKAGRVAFHIRNTCTCAPISQWLIVWDKEEFEEQIHVRELHDKWKKNSYPKQLSLKFYEKREFVMEYVDKYHMGELGGIYGDIRDPGYIISRKRYLGELAKLNDREGRSDLNHLFCFYNQYRHAFYQLNWLKSAFKK